MDMFHIFPFYCPDDDPAPAVGDKSDEPEKDIWKPLTRKELIMSGADIEPLTREEYFLKAQVEASKQSKQSES